MGSCWIEQSYWLFKNTKYMCKQIQFVGSHCIEVIGCLTFAQWSHFLQSNRESIDKIYTQNIENVYKKSIDYNMQLTQSEKKAFNWDKSVQNLYKSFLRSNLHWFSNQSKTSTGLSFSSSENIDTIKNMLHSTHHNPILVIVFMLSIDTHK